MENFNERLKLAMKLRSVNQTKVSEHCKIDKGNLSHYLKGDYMPKQEIIIKLADYLEVNLLWLLGLSSNVSIQSRQLSPVNACKAVGIEPNEKDVMRQTLIDDITAIASRQDLETLKTMYGVIKTLSKK